MVELFQDIEDSVVSSGIVIPENFQWMESQDKLGLKDECFPRIEINHVGEDSINRINQNQVFLAQRFALGMYFRWQDDIDTPQKAKDRLFYCESQKGLLRKAIFSMEMRKLNNLLTCPQFDQIAEDYEINIIHEFIPKHSTIVFYFGINLTDNPFI